MIGCEHCTAMRAEQSAYLATAGCATWIEWAARPVEVFPSLPTWVYRDDATIAACPCDCHSWARIVGRLPRLDRA